ncbi:hypothetical protein [Streptomyces sp. OE57]|uniref:hypothetical protein n=1 Tax=Streptomyces lacaronensis TaxID=3379885 RepID=UPI0039B74601
MRQPVAVLDLARPPPRRQLISPHQGRDLVLVRRHGAVLHHPVDRRPYDGRCLHWQIPHADQGLDHDDRAQFLAGIDLIIAGVTVSPPTA